MPVAIQCRDLRKTYDGKVEAVRGLNLEIQTGECFGLLGPNGAGKTTTIEILEGLLEPTSGEVSILGHSWRENAREMREWLGISLQETRLSEKLTVRETVELFASFYREPRSSEEVLEQLQLTEKGDAWVGKLSGGQRQRLSIARAILADPRILILDEATSSLDSESEAMIQGGLSFLMKGRTTFVIAHRLSTIRRADQILVVEAGLIVERGTHESLYQLGGRYYDLYTRQHGLEENLFLAPGEGDTVEEPAK